MRENISIEIKKSCLAMKESGLSPKEIYDQYFKKQFDNPQSLESFKRSIQRWEKKKYPDTLTLEHGTYEGFIAHDATVRVSKDGEIVEAWIKQRADSFETESFIEAIKEHVEPYNYKPIDLENDFRMLEIPLFDMHWGISFIDHYKSVLDEILYLITSHKWDEIVVPFGQDFFHNDSIVNATTTKGTVIEKVDMRRAVKEAKQFMFSIIDTALSNSNKVKVLYTPGNHDQSISWMFIQVLLERYGSNVVNDDMCYRKIISYGKIAVMVTHGNSKRATPKNLASIFPVSFPEEFANAEVREVHAGHLHEEGTADIFGVMVRRLSTGAKTDEWTDKEDFVGTHKRFMLFEWDSNKLRSIHYI